MKTACKTLLLLGLLVTLAAGCRKEAPLPVNPEDGSPVSGDYVLPVFETTDIHGHIIEKQDGTVHYRLAYIADKVNDVRTQSGRYRKDRLLLLDGGDIYQGASISNLLSGEPVFAAMDMMEYDAVALGNHEFDWGVETLVDPDATMPDYNDLSGADCVNEVPVLCANLFRDGGRVSCTRDYVIVEKTAVHPGGDTIKVNLGIIGFAIDYASSIMTSKFTGQGYAIREDYAIANDLAAKLESSGQCDATILLIHGAADKAARNLGQHSPIDLVLGGHSHSTMSGRSDAGIAYLQGGRYCEHYARAELRFSVDGNGNISFKDVINPRIMSVDATRDLHTYDGQNAQDLDDGILTVSDHAMSDIAEQLDEVVGYITVSASGYGIEGSGGRASVMSNWMCDILRRIGEADVAFVNSGGIRTTFPLGGQRRRDITVAAIYEMFPFNNTTFVYEITYEELLKVLTYSLTSAGQSLFSGMVGIDCHFHGNTVRSLRKDGTVIYQQNQWTDDWASRTMLLAVSEYLATNQRIDNATGLENPLLGWNGTSKLLFTGLVDNENAIRVLREEASVSGGLLRIDTQPHFIEE